MNIYQKTSQLLVYIAIVSMLIQPVAQAKAQSDMVSQVGLQTTANIQSKGLAGLKDLNAQTLLTNKNKKTKQVKIEKSAEEKLSQLSQDIYWQLKDWSGDNKTKAFKQTDKKKITLWLKQINTLEVEVNKNLNKLTKWIVDKKLSKTIMQRQQAAIKKINTEINGLKQQLNQLSLNTKSTVSKSQLKQSFDFFKGKRLKRKHQVFDGLSSVALTPDRIKPATTTKEFSKYKFVTQSKAAQKNADFNNAIYLGTSDEVVINDYIRAKATELENDPVKIYHWVRNNIEWLPSHGAIQASDITLGSGRGNAFDQASLLIAMLRAANVPARYAYGTIEVDIDKFTNWIGLTNPEAAITFVQYGAIPVAPIIEGGVITKVQMEHIWVEAAIDFNPSRGAKNITPDSWVSLDPSFKQYEVLTGLDPIAISGIDMNQVAQDFIDSGTISESEGWVQGFDPTILTTTQAQMQTALEQHITDNIPNPTVGDVIGGRRTIILEYPTLPASLQNKILFKANDFAEMLDQMRPKYRLAFDKDILGDIQNPLELNFAQLNNHKLTLSFKPATVEDEQALAALIPENAQSIQELPSSIPAHLIQVIPQVALDEVVIKTGEPMYLGYDLTLYYQIQFTNGQQMNKEYMIPAGSYVNLMFGAGSVSDKTLSELQINMENTKNILERGDETTINQLTSENIFGETLHFGSINYISQYNIINKAVGKKLDALFGLTPIFGTYGNEANVNYLFGLPINIVKGGVSLNIYTTRQISNNDLDLKTRLLFNQYIGINTSSLEHVAPEQQFSTADNPVEGISTIKALRLAMENGQKIYQIDSQNINQIENLHFHPETIQEITTAVNAGYIVVSHTENVSVQGWTGAGYIIMNPFTGDASFKITGGSNGGFIIALFFVILMAIFIAIIVFPIGLLLGGAALATVVPMLIAAIFSGLALKRLVNAFDNANTEADAQAAILVGIINAVALLYPPANITETANIAFLNIIATLTGYGVDEIRKAFE